MRKTAICLAFSLIFCLFSGCGGTQTTPPELLEPVGVQVDTATVRRGDIRDAVVYDGEIVPYVEEVAFTVSGSLGEVLVMTGDTVEAGQLLARLDSEKIHSQIEAMEEKIAGIQKTGSYSDRQLELDIAIAQKELILLEEEAAATEPSAPEETVPPEDTAVPQEPAAPEDTTVPENTTAPEDTTVPENTTVPAETTAPDPDAEAAAAARKVKEIEIEQLQAKLAQQRALRQAELRYLNSQLSDLKQSLEHVELTAPISGRVVYISSLKPGTSIKSYTTYICIADETQLHLRSEYISQTDIDRAEQVSAKLQDREYPLTYKPVDREEYLSAVLVGVNAYTVFTAEQGFGDAKSGQYAAVLLVNAFKSDVLIIPVNALFQDHNGSYVYVMDNGTQKRQDVTVGVVTDIEVEILEGLQEGDTVYVKE